VNPTRHVLIALSLTAVIFVLADKAWTGNIAKIKPVSFKQRGT
jgi:hypothetical protein